MAHLHFDDRLATILQQPDSRLSVRVGKWRQILDLLVQLGDAPRSDVLHGQLYLREHHRDIPFETLREVKRSLAGRPVPENLQPFLAPPAREPALELADAARSVPQSAASNGARSPLNGTCPANDAGSDDRRRSVPHLTDTSPAMDGPGIFFRNTAPNQPAKPSRKAVSVVPFDQTRRHGAKAAFTTRRVPAEAMQTLVSGAIRPRTGDLVLARVDRLLHQTRIELANGRKAALHPGDEIIVAYGDRYATDQFEAEVPHDLGPTNLVATGGVASRMLSRTSGIRQASHITPIGLIGDARGTPLNLRQFALPRLDAPMPRPRTVAVLGTSMNSGKTTTNRYLTAGLSRAGLKPGAVKITGTGSGGDYWVMADAGAHRVLDFTDAGYSSTYKIPGAEIEAAALTLIEHLTADGCGVILVEVADGLFHDQNAELIRSAFFRDSIDGVFFAAGEAMGAAEGVRELRSLGIPVLGVSGKLTGSELLIREATRHIDAPIFTKAELGDPAMAPRLVGLDVAAEVAPAPAPPPAAAYRETAQSAGSA
ncbi:MAG TPA: hypothetical protein VF680_13460 [Allosphingosinicella sp.]